TISSPGARTCWKPWASFAPPVPPASRVTLNSRLEHGHHVADQPLHGLRVVGMREAHDEVPEADPQVRTQDLRDLLRRAHWLVLPWPGATVALEELLEDALRLRRVVADDAHPGAHRPLDLRLVATHLRAVTAQDLVLVLDVGEPPSHVAGIRVLGNGAQRALLAPTATQDREPLLHGRRLIPD